MKKRWIVRVALLLVVVAAAMFVPSYVKRHYVTNRVDTAAAVDGARIEHGRRVLTVYFSRVGCSDFAPDVDAVSGASLMIDGDTLVGNCELLAKMVHNAAGGDLYAIRTEKRYPSTYGATIAEARTEMNAGERPALVGALPDMTRYDTVFLVYPVWWHTVPAAVTSFLEKVDMSGVALFPIASHGGSREARSVDDIRAVCRADVREVICVYDDDVPTSRESLGRAVSERLSR